MAPRLIAFEEKLQSLNLEVGPTCTCIAGRGLYFPFAMLLLLCAQSSVVLLLARVDGTGVWRHSTTSEASFDGAKKQKKKGTRPSVA